jgi:hypothetical protein
MNLISIYRRNRVPVTRMMFVLLLVGLTWVGMATAQVSSGLNSAEGPQINGCDGLNTSGCGTTATDTFWADSSVQRWRMNNHTVSSPMIVAQWPCVNGGCIPYSAATATSGVYPETALPIGAQNSFLQVSSSTLPNWSAYTLPSSMSTCASGNPLLSNGTNVVCGSTISAGLKLPTSASYTSTVNGQIGYDTTANIYHFGVNSADAKVPTFTATPSSGSCAGWTGAATIGTTCPTLDQIGALAATATNTFAGTSRLTLAGGVTTAFPAVTITNLNSTNSNASTALAVTTTGTSTGAIPLAVNQGNSSLGDIVDFEHNGTIVASVNTAGFFASQNTMRRTSDFPTTSTSLTAFLSWSLPASGTLTYRAVLFRIMIPCG